MNSGILLKLKKKKRGLIGHASKRKVEEQVRERGASEQCGVRFIQLRESFPRPFSFSSLIC